MSTVLRIESVGKCFGSVVAVDSVTLDVRENEFLALLGASGCGKTTLLRLMAGLESPDAGRIFIDGKDVTADPPYARPVNMMFQSYALFPHMTVAENVAFGLKQDGLSGEALGERVKEALTAVELEDLGERKPHQLSGGQRQRAALARCIAKRPRVLLLDEPMAALDKHLRERTQRELKALRARLGITFVVVTHDQSEAMAMADRVAVMEAGRILQLDTPRALYERPASARVARFFGDINMWQAATGKTLALRPERIRISHGPSPNSVAGVVQDTVYLGTATTCFVKTTAGDVLRVMNAEGEVTFKQGDAVHLSWPESAVMELAE
jgi:putrescine transport system ATP-binding protein